MKKKISASIDAELLKKLDSLIDGNSIRNRSQAIEYLIKNAPQQDIKIGVILAGGDKQKLKFKNTYKPLFKIDGKEIILHTVEKLKNAGVKKIYIISNSIINEISKIVSNIDDIDISFIVDDSKGTSGALYKLKKISEPMIVVSGDVYFDFDLKKMIDFHKSKKSSVTIAVTTTDISHSKDSIEIEGDKIIKFEYKPKKPSYYSNAGIYIFEPDALTYILSEGSLERDVFPKLSKMGKLMAYLISGKWFHAD